MYLENKKLKRYKTPIFNVKIKLFMKKHEQTFLYLEVGGDSKLLPPAPKI